jgi:hypothetical protein
MEEDPPGPADSAPTSRPNTLPPTPLPRIHSEIGDASALAPERPPPGPPPEPASTSPESGKPQPLSTREKNELLEFRMRLVQSAERRRIPSAAAEDLAQKGIFVGLRKMSVRDPSFRPYVLQVVGNQINQYFRDQRAAGPAPVVESMTSADVELYLMHIHIPQEIPRLLKKLEPYDRRVLKSLLRWYASNPTKTWHGAESAVARTLKVHRNTASRHLQIALLHFQELINNDVDLNKIRESCHTKPNSLEVDHD